MLLLVIVKFLLILAYSESLTMKQLRNMGRVMRKNCQPKNNLEDAQVNPINEGIFSEEKDVKCYIACVMKMTNTLKNGKLDAEAAVKQIDLLFPEDMKEGAKAAILACWKVGNSYKDTCDASYYTTKCIHDHNPSIFFFP